MKRGEKGKEKKKLKKNLALDLFEKNKNHGIVQKVVVLLNRTL